MSEISITVIEFPPPDGEKVQMGQLDYLCTACNVQQHADGICANCGAAALVSTEKEN